MAQDDPKNTRQEASDAYEKFHELTRRLVSVPKTEADKKEAAYQRKKAKRKRRSV